MSLQAFCQPEVAFPERSVQSNPLDALPNIITPTDSILTGSFGSYSHSDEDGY